jgi:hypothetical protein
MGRVQPNTKRPFDTRNCPCPHHQFGDFLNITHALYTHRVLARTERVKAPISFITHTQEKNLPANIADTSLGRHVISHSLLLPAVTDNSRFFPSTAFHVSGSQVISPPLRASLSPSNPIPSIPQDYLKSFCHPSIHVTTLLRYSTSTFYQCLCTIYSNTTIIHYLFIIKHLTNFPTYIFEKPSLSLRDNFLLLNDL